MPFRDSRALASISGSSTFELLNIAVISQEFHLNLGEIHEANSKAISLCAYVPPYLLAFATIPLECVFSTHCLTVKNKSVKASLIFNSLEFEGIKLCVIHFLPFKTYLPVASNNGYFY